MKLNWTLNNNWFEIESKLNGIWSEIKIYLKHELERKWTWVEIGLILKWYETVTKLKWDWIDLA